MNVKLLRKVAKYILAEPKRLDMNVTGIATLPDDEDAPKCGTVGCIAGWASVLALPAMPASPKFRASVMTWESGRIKLKLNCEEASRLFTEPDSEAHDGWPVRFRTAYAKAKTHRGRARVTARRIEHFIKTGGKE
jgi:hypothetical protein